MPVIISSFPIQLENFHCNTVNLMIGIFQFYNLLYDENFLIIEFLSIGKAIFHGNSFPRDLNMQHFNFPSELFVLLLWYNLLLFLIS